MKKRNPTSLLEGGGPPAGGGRSSRASRPYHPSRALSKHRIQLRVQGRNPARFKGGYGVPRGFKGGSKPSAPCGRLSEAEHPKRKGATLLRPLSTVNRNRPGNSHSRASAPCDFRFPPCFFPHSGRMAPIPLIPPRPSGARPRIARRLCNRFPYPSPQRPPSSREGDRPQAVEGVPAILTSSRTPAGQNLRFCRRLHIGALRSPL